MLLKSIFIIADVVMGIFENRFTLNIVTSFSVNYTQILSMFKLVSD